MQEFLSPCRDRRLLDERAKGVLEEIRRDGESAPEPLRPAFAYLADHLFDAKLDVPAVRGSCPDLDSSRSFGRQFRRVASTTVREYVQCCRVRVAERLLAETGLTVAAIARLVGYSTVFAFRKAFKARRGFGPHEWRERLPEPPPPLEDPLPTERVDCWRQVLLGIEIEQRHRLFQWFANAYHGAAKSLRRNQPAARRIAKYERSKARRAVSVIEQKGLDEISATELVRLWPQRGLALHHLLLEKATECEAEDPRGCVRWLRLALTSLKACAEHSKSEVSAEEVISRRVLVLSRLARAWLAVDDETESLKAISRARTEWDLAPTLDSPRVEAELLEAEGLAFQVRIRRGADRAVELYRQVGAEGAVTRCLRLKGD